MCITFLSHCTLELCAVQHTSPLNTRPCEHDKWRPRRDSGQHRWIDRDLQMSSGWHAKFPRAWSFFSFRSRSVQGQANYRLHHMHSHFPLSQLVPALQIPMLLSHTAKCWRAQLHTGLHEEGQVHWRVS